MCSCLTARRNPLLCCVLQLVEAVLQVVSSGCAAAPEALQLLGPALQLILTAGVPVQRPDLENLDGDGVSQALVKIHVVKTCILLYESDQGCQECDYCTEAMHKWLPEVECTTLATSSSLVMGVWRPDGD